MGAQKALEVLQGHIVRYLKERMGKKKRKKTNAGGVAEKGVTKTGKADASERSSPFTTVPLPSRIAQSSLTCQVPIAPSPASMAPSDICPPAIECPPVGVKAVPSSLSSPPVPVPIYGNSRSQSPTIVVVDEDDEEGRVTKRRKLGSEAGAGTLLKCEESTARVSQDVDEDIEVDVC